ncbi:hypothetical protein LCGC14_0302680 [marine sediment metagenome]|uniref:Uncharacterized protein n=1 Tax=marine sediment metagenome TaxID=412755 RepID=A0A0F9WB78_9ZZZZ
MSKISTKCIYCGERAHEGICTIQDEFIKERISNGDICAKHGTDIKYGKPCYPCYNEGRQNAKRIENFRGQYNYLEVNGDTK